MHGFRYSVNTNCLRKRHTPAALAALIRRAGYDGVEWGLPSLEETPAAVREMAQAAADQGLEVASYINAGALWKTDLVRRWSEAVAAVGGKRLRVSQPWVSFNFDQSVHQRDGFLQLEKLTREGLERLVPLSREYGIQYIVEMHMGGIVTSAESARSLVAGLDPETVGIIYDPANTIFEGSQRPRTSVELLGAHLAYVHVKNLILRPDTSQPDPAPRVRRQRFNWALAGLREGMLDWAEVAFALRLARWTGWLSMEEFFVEDSEAKLVDARQFIQECLASVPTDSAPPYAQNND